MPESAQRADDGCAHAALLEEAHAGLTRRLSAIRVSPAQTARYRERCDYECSTLEATAAASNFLVAGEHVEWARRSEIALGPGRGLTTCSLVAWCLGITEVDPLEQRLPFERFVNATRGDDLVVDIDIDVDARRHADLVRRVDAGRPQQPGRRINIFPHEGVTLLAAIASIVDQRMARDVFDVHRLPLADTDVFETISAGEVPDLPGIDTGGTTRDCARLLDPCSLEELEIVVALARPVTIERGITRSVCARKQEIEPSDAPHPRLESHLEDTFGVLVFQEQLMLIAHDVAGYSLAEADSLRRTLAKKKPSEVEQARVRFLAGARESGECYSDAARILAILEQGAAECFPRFLAVTSALLLYQAAYVRFHFPDEFACARIKDFEDGLSPSKCELSLA